MQKQKYFIVNYRFYELWGEYPTSNKHLKDSTLISCPCNEIISNLQFFFRGLK